MKWGWNTVDDEGNIVGKTTVRDDGKIDRYDATNGDFSNGHGHNVYSSMDEYIDSCCASFAGEKTGGDIYSRDSNDDDSIGREWEERGEDD